MNKYTVEQVVATLGAFRGETYRRAIGFQMQDIIQRVDAQMDAATA